MIYTTTDNIKAIYEMPLLGDNKKAEKRVSEEAQIVFCTECDDADGFDMYLFDLKTKYIQKVPFFSKETNEYAIRNDVVRWKGEIYYMRCSYNDGDMNNSLTCAESIDDGIYRLDLVKEKFEKISEDVGEFLIVIDNNLCVVRDSFMQFLLCMISYVFRHPVQIRLLYKNFHLHRDKAYPSRPCSVLYI